MKDSKAAAIFAALRELEGVDDELLWRPEIAHLPSILEGDETPECVTKNSRLSIVVATDRRVINIKRSLWNLNSIKKVESYLYADIYSIKAGRGSSEHPLAIETSEKTHGCQADKESRFAFAEFVAGKIRPAEPDAANDDPAPLAPAPGSPARPMIRGPEQQMKDSKAAAIFAALRKLEGVDDELLGRPEIAHLPSILEGDETPECVTKCGQLSIVVATDRRVINIEQSVWNNSIKKVESYLYADIYSIKAGRGIFELSLAIETSEKTHGCQADKESRFAFAEFVAGKIRPAEPDAAKDDPAPLAPAPSSPARPMPRAERVVNKPAEANPRVAEIEAQLRALDDASRFLGRREIKELPNILWDSEQIHDIVQGSYDSGFGILVSTDRRLIFVNKGMIYGLKVEDFPNDKITSIQYETKLLFGSITIFASGNKAVVKDVDKNQVRTFSEGVRARVAAGSFPATEQPSPSGGPTENDMAGQLEKLAALKEKGILTEEEFTAKKKQILGI